MIFSLKSEKRKWEPTVESPRLKPPNRVKQSSAHLRAAGLQRLTDDVVSCKVLCLPLYFRLFLSPSRLRHCRFLPADTTVNTEVCLNMKPQEMNPFGLLATKEMKRRRWRDYTKKNIPVGLNCIYLLLKMRSRLTIWFSSFNRSLTGRLLTRAAVNEIFSSVKIRTVAKSTHMTVSSLTASQ